MRCAPRRALPDFRAAVSVHLVETSPVLRARQQADAREQRGPIAWHDAIEDVPDGPAIAIANEFVDALPVDQFVKDRDGWHLRMVGLADGKLGFHGRAPDADCSGMPRAEAPSGAILERRHDQPIALLARRIAAAWRRGADHRLRPRRRRGFGDTLQAVRASQFADPLADPGRSRPHHAGRFRRARA